MPSIPWFFLLVLSNRYGRNVLTSAFTLTRVYPTWSDSKLMVSIMRPNVAAPSLEEFDADLAAMVRSEDRRQRKGLELIASENFVSKAVREVLGSCLTNKYSEGGGESPVNTATPRASELRKNLQSTVFLKFHFTSG